MHSLVKGPRQRACISMCMAVALPLKWTLFLSLSKRYFVLFFLSSNSFSLELDVYNLQVFFFSFLRFFTKEKRAALSFSLLISSFSFLSLVFVPTKTLGTIYSKMVADFLFKTRRTRSPVWLLDTQLSRYWCCPRKREVYIAYTTGSGVCDTEKKRPTNKYIYLHVEWRVSQNSSHYSSNWVLHWNSKCVDLSIDQ